MTYFPKRRPTRRDPRPCPPAEDGTPDMQKHAETNFTTPWCQWCRAVKLMIGTTGFFACPHCDHVPLNPHLPAA